jgi:hypothetical protein
MLEHNSFPLQKQNPSRSGAKILKVDHLGSRAAFAHFVRSSTRKHQKRG